MKNFLLLSFLSAFLPAAFSQVEIHGYLSNQRSTELTVLKPVNGKYIPFNRETVPIGQDGHFVLRSDDTVPGVFLLFTELGMAKVFAEPGQPDTLFADGEARHLGFTFRGANSHGNAFLNSLSREDQFTGFGNTQTEKALKYDTLPEIIYGNVMAMRQAELDSLQAQKLRYGFSKQFVEMAEADIRYYHVGLFNGICVSEYGPTERGKVTRFNEHWAKLWGQMMHSEGVSNAHALSTEWYYQFAYWYIGTYRGRHLGEKAIPNPDWQKGEHLLNADTLIRQHFQEPALEYVLAATLMDEMAQYQFQYPLIELYERFRAEYPASEFLPVLEKSAAPVYAYFESLGKPLPEGIHILEDSLGISSLQQLYERFPDQPIFVDVWATWCGPCKREFAFKKDIEAAMQEMGVTMLYVSVDDVGMEKRWREMLKQYGLKGYHIRCNKELYQSVYDYFVQNGLLSIPRYALVGRDGLTLVPDAKRPSDGKALIEQVGRSLKK